MNKWSLRFILAVLIPFGASTAMGATEAKDSVPAASERPSAANGQLSTMTPQSLGEGLLKMLTQQKGQEKGQAKVPAKGQTKVQAKGQAKVQTKVQAKSQEKSQAKGQEKGQAKGQEKGQAKGQEKGQISKTVSKTNFNPRIPGVRVTPVRIPVKAVKSGYVPPPPKPAVPQIRQEIQRILDLDKKIRSLQANRSAQLQRIQEQARIHQKILGDLEASKKKTAVQKPMDKEALLSQEKLRIIREETQKNAKVVEEIQAKAAGEAGKETGKKTGKETGKKTGKELMKETSKETVKEKPPAA